MDKIKWHPAFYAATELELHEDVEVLELIPEYNLSKEPIRIDLLILKNRSERLKNEIGHIMRTYNVIEYKSPKDDLNIDDFYKTISYAGLYKGYGKTVNEIPSDEITVSLFREGVPKKLFETLKQEGYSIEEKYKGIYYVTGKVMFPVQIVVTSQLDKRLHSSLRVLSENAERDDVERFLLESKKRASQGEKNNINAVLLVSSDANPQVYEKIRKDTDMSHVWEELMKDVIDERVAQGIAQGIEQGRAEMQSENEALQKEIESLRIQLEQVKK